MKITRERLKQIIKEELQEVVSNRQSLETLQSELLALTFKPIKELSFDDNNKLVIYTNIKTPDGFPETMQELLSHFLTEKIISKLSIEKLTSDPDGYIEIHTYLTEDEKTGLLKVPRFDQY